MNSILFDIGATKTRMAYSLNGEFFEEPVVFETSKDFQEGFSNFIETARNLAKDREIKKIVGGMSRSIENWDEQVFKNRLKEKFNSQIVIENDSAMVGLGEARFGAGRGFEIVAYITVSSGVGGVRIIDGKIDERAIGFEPGKQIIDIERKLTLEDLISGKSLEKREGRHPREISDQNVWEDLAYKLAVGLNNIAVEWSPDIIVLGGSMIVGDPAISVELAEKNMKEILKVFPKFPVVKKAELGDFGGLYGALFYTKNI